MSSHIRTMNASNIARYPLWVLKLLSREEAFWNYDVSQASSVAKKKQTTDR